MKKSKKQKKYIVDENGKRISVILPIDQYEKLLEAWEELEDIIAYDKAKTSKSEYIYANIAFER